MTDFGVVCGLCGGGVYMETCGINGCEWATAGECQTCGERNEFQCEEPEHRADTSLVTSATNPMDEHTALWSEEMLTPRQEDDNPVPPGDQTPNP